MNTPYTFANLLKIINQSTYLLFMLMVGLALILIEDPQFAAVTTMIIGCIGLGLLFGKLTSMVKRKEFISQTNELKSSELLQATHVNEVHLKDRNGFLILLELLFSEKSIGIS